MLKENLNHTSHFAHHTSNKGITLIALIITIIVMLILVAVTITTAINGGLFEKAGEAVGEMQNAINKEQELANGKIEIGGVLYDSIDDYLNNTPSALHNWTRTGDTFTCSHCNITCEMGQVINYTPSGKTSTTMTASKSGLDRYYADNSSSYPSGANVYANGIQTIAAQDTNWIVLGIEDTNGDEIYETLLITTESPVEGLYFYGAAAYNNAASYIGADGKKVEGEIDRICRELYSNSEYGKARGMTIEDVNSALNYTPKGGMYLDNSGFHELDGFNTTYKEYVTKIGKYVTEEEFDKAVEDGELVAPEQGKNVGEYPINGYVYAASGNSEVPPGVPILSETTSTKVKEVIFGSSADYNYWLASRGVCANPVYAGFGLGGVYYGDVYSFGGLFGSDGYEGRDSAGLRPVVSLKSKLPKGFIRITFTIEGETYEALEGMTWEEWGNSSFCTDEFHTTLGKDVVFKGYFLSQSETFEYVLADDLIVPNGTYIYGDC